jgi:hypothetical protein
LLAESPREPGNAIDDLRGGVHGRKTDNAFLQVNHNQGGDGIELCERHGFPFGRGAGRSFSVSSLVIRSHDIPLRLYQPAREIFHTAEGSRPVSPQGSGKGVAAGIVGSPAVMNPPNAGSTRGPN